VTLDKKGVHFHKFLIREIELKFLDFTGIFKLSKRKQLEDLGALDLGLFSCIVLGLMIY
jgi:hypothetical protein